LWSFCRTHALQQKTVPLALTRTTDSPRSTLGAVTTSHKRNMHHASATCHRCAVFNMHCPPQPTTARTSTSLHSTMQCNAMQHNMMQSHARFTVATRRPRSGSFLFGVKFDLFYVCGLRSAICNSPGRLEDPVGMMDVSRLLSEDCTCQQPRLLEHLHAPSWPRTRLSQTSDWIGLDWIGLMD
jgi:hypothetical protein